MAGRAFALAKWNGTFPEVQYLLVKASQTFKAGAVVLTDANGELLEASADPAVIKGVALSQAGSALGYNMSNAGDIVAATGREDKVAVAIANNASIFSGRAVNGGTDPVTPLQTHVDEEYGVLKDADGIWTIDIAEVTVKSVHIVGFDLSTKSFLFKFIASFQQQP